MLQSPKRPSTLDTWDPRAAKRSAGTGGNTKIQVHWVTDSFGLGVRVGFEVLCFGN